MVRASYNTNDYTLQEFVGKHRGCMVRASYNTNDYMLQEFVG